MRRISRRAVLAAAVPCLAAPRSVQSVRGSVPANQLGVTLVHEHILVDFIGADRVSASRYDRDDVIRAALPKLRELRKRGCQTLVECTPAYLGRNPLLLRELAGSTGLTILTNTGYYGARNHRFLPKHAFTWSAEQIARLWVQEAEQGIEDTGIRPAFLKLGVDAGAVSEVNRKLIAAAVLCWRRTGLRIHVHTGDGIAAEQILDILQANRAPAAAYVWVHAQNEGNRQRHLAAARAGAWVEFDGVSRAGHDQHLSAVLDLAREGLLQQVLISQDSGWYHVGEPGGGQFNGYTYLFDEFIPALRNAGFTQQQIHQLLIDNPRRLFST